MKYGVHRAHKKTGVEKSNPGFSDNKDMRNHGTQKFSLITTTDTDIAYAEVILAFCFTLLKVLTETSGISRD